MRIEIFKEALARKSGTTVKDVCCERCGFEYVYQFQRRTAREVATNVGFYDYKAAEARASDNLTHVLRDSCDPVPCPNCGWYQRPMVLRARQLRYRALRATALVILMVAFPL
jgi:hypothetical protein